ncbi:hypothetical protein BROUX41_000080 [Berkeleyomyces rouxiae]
MLDRCRRQAAVRIASLDEFHPLARLARARTSTRLTLRHRKLPRAPPTTRILPLAYSPPKPPEPKDAQRIRAAKSRIARIPYCDLRVFSDGSKLQDGSTGAAAALYITGLELPTVSIHLGKMMEVYDAELIEALTGLKAALQSPAATFAENVIVMLDNQEAAYRLLIGQPTLTSQGIILDFRATADRRPLRTRNSISPGPGKVMVQWIPGHTDIPGNEAADRAAKAAVSTPPPEHHESVSSLAALASWARSQHLKNVTAYWHGNIPGTYLELQIPCIQVLLGTPKGAILFARFLGASNFLTRGNLGMARQKRLIDMVSKVTTNVAEVIVPAYRTTPHAALYREAGILPAPLMLDRCRRNAAVRATGLDEHHPLARMIRSRAYTCLTLRHSELPRAPIPPRVLPLDHPPPRPPDIKDVRQIRAAKAHIMRIPLWDVQIFSDGSKLQDGSTGVAAVLYAAGHTLPSTAAHLGEAMEVYDAELYGALIGLKAALKSPAAAFAENAVILLDNQEAAYRLLTGTPTKTSQDVILEFRATAALWPLRTRNAFSSGPGRVIVH